MKHITNSKGEWTGHIDERSDSTIYTDTKGKVIARVMNDKTYDGKGRFTGQGDLGMIEIGKKLR